MQPLCISVKQWVPSSVFSDLHLLHTCTIYLQDETIGQYNKSLFLAENYFIDRLFKDNIHLFVKELKTWGPDYQIYYEKLDKIKDQIVKLGDHLFVKNEPDKGYNVLNHGDFHTRNMLVKWNENHEKVNDIILVSSTWKWHQLPDSNIYFRPFSWTSKYAIGPPLPWISFMGFIRW